MTAKWLEYERYPELATHFLLKNKKTLSAVVMRELCGGNSSLSTHQNLLVRWKNETDNDIVGLPEKAEAIIVRKARELFEEVWKALEDGCREQNTKIKQDADETIQTAREAMDCVTHEKNETQKELNRISEELNRANADNGLYRYLPVAVPSILRVTSPASNAITFFILGTPCA